MLLGVLILLLYFRSCKNLVPGLEKISSGVDVSTLDILPVTTQFDKGFGRSILSYTCANNKKWKDPFSNRIYNLPDQISSINELPGSIFEAKSSYNMDFESIKQSMAVDVGIEFLPGMFSASSSYQRSLYSMTNQSRYIITVDSFFSAFKVDLRLYWSSEIYNNEFYQFINHVIPDTYDGNENKYHELFQTFGTHFFSSGLFGGMYRMIFEINKSLTQTLSTDQIEASAKANFFNSVLNLTDDHESSSKYVSEQFVQNSNIIMRKYGGQVFEYNDNYKKWVESIPEHPWLFNGYLRPISDAFPESLAHKKKQVNFATIVYLDKAYLTDIKNALGLYIETVIEKETGKQLIKRITELLKEKIPNHDNVTQIKSDVDEYLKTSRNSYGYAKIEVRTAYVRDSNVIFKLDPYCRVYAENREFARTSTARSTQYPKWFQTFITPYINIQTPIRLCVWDKNQNWDDKQIGCGSTTVQEIIDKKLEGKPSTQNSFKDYWLEATVWWIPKPN